ncbi:uncharacterized protein MONOS_4598 [Monocercomonoides exilis]|uniref:uncharacterized protein n=1 Tax=Monocercomonoides exilis TaxID=2049356 RepID=UPI00355A19C9|nr:hypothetical protein MONOS_4598 [Monocercomonoides exilis]|eukprot:MONOS_4598.1-p1 / transcript=MONOS_4598.1 / gene=MONOS_4598 / organism=Monocercomonoides_exilis_PA203 / gene_product=Hypothetical protein GLP15_2507 / transcript_product=Hypothetical protein GLP15_2507 / location=Mono_scaffold00124:38691-42209(+) / protein_length=827 / sequence_SO=supercontig / SO=protein_coding / is_pseudo=false
MIIFIFALSFSAVCNDGDCKFTTKTAVEYQVLKECLKSFELDETKKEKEATLNAILKMLDMHAMKDAELSLHEPYADESFDLEAELNKLYNNDYADAESFYSEIASLFGKSRDNQLAFQKPCSRNFAFVLPFGIKAEESEDGSDVHIYFTALPAAFKFVTEQHLQEHGGDNLTNYEILYISLDDSKPTQAERALETINRWATDNLFISRNSASRFTRAVQIDFAVRLLERLPIPPTSTIQVTVKKEGDEESDVTIPWYGVSLQNITDFKSLCPLLNVGSSSNSAERENAQVKREKTKKKSTVLGRIFESVEETTFIPDGTNFFKHLEVPDAKGQNEGEEDTMEELFKGQFLSFYEVKEQEKNIGFMRLGAFYRSEHGHDIFTEEMTYANTLMRERAIDYLIVDVRSNSGGHPTLAMNTLQYLVGNVYPLMPEVDVRKNKIYTQLESQAILSQVPRYQYLTDKSISTTWYTSGRTRTFSKEDNSTFTHDYSSKYMLDITDEEEHEEEHLETLLEDPNHRTFDPQHLLFVTDGLCGGSCALMLDRVVEGHLGKVVFAGSSIDMEHQNSKSNEDIDLSKYSVGTYPFGSYHDSDWIHSLKVSYPKAKLDTLPAEFVRKGVGMRWAFEEPYTYNWELRKKVSEETKKEGKEKGAKDVLEFVRVSPDAVASHFPTPDEFTAKRFKTLAQGRLVKYFDVCFKWEVELSPECATKAPRRSHKVYGHPCNATTQQFDTSQCVFAQCEVGYYYNGIEDMCLKIPVRKYQTGAWQVGIALSVVLVAVTGMLSVLVLWQLLKGKSERVKYVPIADDVDLSEQSGSMTKEGTSVMAPPE